MRALGSDGHGRGAPLRVLVVDDSALARQVISTLLGSEPGIEVEVAATPLIALQKIARRAPDVILLDLQMPKMSGLHFLERLMPTHPIPVVVCSGVAARGSELALQALRAGAVELVSKPDFARAGEEARTLLLDAIRAAAHARMRTVAQVARAAAPGSALDTSFELTPREVAPLGRHPLIALGASTGGTEALRVVLSSMPADAPPLVIVQHMPAPFTAAFASHLAASCRIAVREAVDGEQAHAGCALIAPGGRHMRVSVLRGKYVVHVQDGPLVSRHRPSVDVLFESVARAAGPEAVGVLMTGMGADGADGLLTMRRAGAQTIAQDEATSVVFGMPKEAVARGAAQVVLPLGRIASAALAASTRLRKPLLEPSR